MARIVTLTSSASTLSVAAVYVSLLAASTAVHVGPALHQTGAKPSALLHDNDKTTFPNGAHLAAAHAAPVVGAAASRDSAGDYVGPMRVMRSGNRLLVGGRSYRVRRRGTRPQPPLAHLSPPLSEPSTAAAAAAVQLARQGGSRPQTTLVQPALASDRSGSCVFGGRLFRHGGRVRRPESACDRCMCFSGEMLCWRTRCPPMPKRLADGCRERLPEGVCCPLVECDPSAAASSSNSSTSGISGGNSGNWTDATSRHALGNYGGGSVSNGAVNGGGSVSSSRDDQRSDNTKFDSAKFASDNTNDSATGKNKNGRLVDCEIEGRHFAYGEIIPQASSACLECRCGRQGQMKCRYRACHLTDALDLAKVANVVQNERTPSKPVVHIIQHNQLD